MEPEDLPEIPESASPKLRAVTRAIQEHAGGDYGLKTAMKAIEAYEAVQEKPVSLMDCAMALQGNQRIKLGSDLQQIAKAVLDKAQVKYD